MEEILKRIEKGDADEEEIPMLEEISRQIENHTICALGDAAAWPVQGLIRHYQPQMVQRIRERDSFDSSQYFQKSWTGSSFENDEWVQKMRQQWG